MGRLAALSLLAAACAPSPARHAGVPPPDLILYDNAARFLRLSEEEIARHHGRTGRTP